MAHSPHLINILALASRTDIRNSPTMKLRRLSLLVLAQSLHVTTSFFPRSGSFSSSGWVCPLSAATCSAAPCYRMRTNFCGIIVTSPKRYSQTMLFSTTESSSGSTSEAELGQYEDAAQRRGSWESEDAEEEDEQSTDDTGGEASDDPLTIEYKQWDSAVKNSMKGLEKKQQSLQHEMQKAAKIEETVARAQLLTANLYMFTRGVKSVTVQDWEQDGLEVELTLNSDFDSAASEADALFQKVRKLKRGSQVVGELLDATSFAVESLKEIQVDLNAVCEENGVNEDLLRFVQDRLLRTARSTGFLAPRDKDTPSGRASMRGPVKATHKAEIGTPASNVRKLKSAGGCTVLVGRNRRGNEKISCQIAKGDDIWLHSRGCPGAHVLIQQRRGSSMATEECIQFGCDLAIFYSDARSERKAPVTAAEPKHIQKPRGAPLGAVKLREEWKVFTGFPDSVPDDLKHARDESGQTDEYRKLDKAKHRKRTKQAAKQQDATRKAKAKAKRKQK